MSGSGSSAAYIRAVVNHGSAAWGCLTFNRDWPTSELHDMIPVPAAPIPGMPTSLILATPLHVNFACLSINQNASSYRDGFLPQNLASSPSSPSSEMPLQLNNIMKIVTTFKSMDAQIWKILLKLFPLPLRYHRI